MSTIIENTKSLINDEPLEIMDNEDNSVVDAVEDSASDIKEIKKNIKILKRRVTKKENVENKENFKNLDMEDEKYLKYISNYTPNETRKGKNVINQKNIFDFFTSMRISFQKILPKINSLPPAENLKNYIDESNSLIFKKTLSEMLMLLNSFLSFYKKYISKHNYIEKTLQNDSFDLTQKISDQIELNLKFFKDTVEMENLDISHLEVIIDSIKSFSNEIFMITEKIINIWYNKALVYSNKSNQKTKIMKILNNNFCEHIKRNLDNIKQKNKSNYRIRSNQPENKKEVNVYEDNEFYNFLLKEFILNKESTNTEENLNNSNRTDLTLNYLLNRSKNKKDKNVDTKASKNRKLKFEKHEKIINFTVPLKNNKCDSGRNEIINSIFGLSKRRIIESEEMDVDII